MHTIELTNQVPVDIVYPSRFNSQRPLCRLRILEYGKPFDMSDVTIVSADFFTEAGVYISSSASTTITNRANAEIAFETMTPVSQYQSGRFRVQIYMYFANGGNIKIMRLPFMGGAANQIWVDLT